MNESRSGRGWNDPTPREWAEALFLSRRMGRPSQDPGEPESDEPGRDHPRGAKTAGPGTPPVHREQAGSGRDESRTVEQDDPGPTVGSPVAADRNPVLPRVAQTTADGPAGEALAVGGGLGDPWLPDPLGLARALRPLGRREPDRRRQELDEESTAVRSAELGFWEPVLRDVSEAWLEVALIVEDSLTMRVWQESAAALAQLLQYHGAFRDVRVWRLDTGRPDRPALRTVDGDAERHPGELIHPQRRRLVLVVSDCTSSAWSHPELPQLLHRWATHQPLAVLHTLPSRFWERTAAVPLDARLRSTAAGAPNSRIQLRLGRTARSLVDPGPTTEHTAEPVPVPVLALEPAWLDRWANLVAHSGSGWTRAAVLLVDRQGWRMPAPRPHSQAVPGSAQRLSAAETVRRFASVASPAALMLAIRLAFLPLTWDVMRAVQRDALPGSGSLPLAEVLLGGLLERLAPEPSSPATPDFDFREDVRSHLLGRLGRGELYRTLQSAQGPVTRLLGAQPLLMERLLRSPATVTEEDISEADRVVLAAAVPALRALGQPYEASARRAADSGSPARLPVTASAGTNEAAAGSGSRGGPEGSPTHDDETVDAVPVDGEEKPDVTAPEKDLSEPDTPISVAPDVPVGAGPPSDGRPPVVAVRPQAMPGRVPLPNPAFVGRERELSQLRSSLLAGGHTALLAQAIYGLGGVGKTQLAIEYIRRHGDDYDRVWWVRAEQDLVIRADYAALARELNLEPHPDEDITETVVRALSTGSPVRRWLLVLDNAGDPATTREYIPTMVGIPDGIGHVIVTSRDRNWANMVRALQVDVFTREESMAFLARRGAATDTDAAHRLAASLGDLPLALESAAALHEQSGMPTEEYLHLLQTQRTEILAQGPDRSGASVVAAFQISLQRLREHVGARELLDLLAFFGPDPIPSAFLHHARLLRLPDPLGRVLREPFARRLTIAEIGRYSLLTVDPRNDTLQLHRLLRGVLQDSLPPQERSRLRDVAQTVLSVHDPGEPQFTEGWRHYAELLPHMEPSDSLDSDAPEVRVTVLNLIHYVYLNGDLRGSARLAERAYDAWRERLGADDLHTLRAARRLAAAWWALGEYERSRPLNQETLDRLLRTVGQDHGDAITLSGAVAADLRAVGRFPEALGLDRNAYERSRAVFGPDDAGTMTAGHNYAVSLRMNGHFADALALDRGNADQRLRIGRYDLQSLLSANNVARDLRELGRYSEAVLLQEQTVADYRRHYGDRDANTLRALKNHAVTLRRVGRRPEALGLMRESYDGYRAIYGEKHLDTVAALVGLGTDLRLNGHLAAARTAGADAVAEYRELLGPLHPFVHLAGLDLAIVLRALGETARAHELSGAAVEVLPQALGPEHPWVALARVGLGNSLAASREPGAAAALDAEAARALTERFGEQHPATLAARRNHALDLSALGDETESAERLAEVRHAYEETLGPDHPETRAALAGDRAEVDIEPPPI
ncbi:FxSxx-COOH system tetratricopeptide repeat protein [Streptomyces sp. NBC_00102]|uniref:FxSxx-COOH system tetratricopeptide repeat protein n=1 Tax=Streptomyces sp. NBC_00102 TaxID=2975652 RepID=UPI00225855A5|nr:FxSxx-COOH system tetratricopeptide repeat protein [Streptomyces sp. NBC_00102]MCX5400541.1 FxSxx-COOH system tetratricopeptide repeat protein [Streptomyces sp. NBC_00102]